MVEQRTEFKGLLCSVVFSPENVQHLLEAFLSVFVGVLTLSKISCLKDIDLWWPLRSIGGSTGVGVGGGVNCRCCRGSSILPFLRPRGRTLRRVLTGECVEVRKTWEGKDLLSSTLDPGREEERRGDKGGDIVED